MEKHHLLSPRRPTATWLSYLEHLHSTTIELGLGRVSQVAERMALLKPAPFVFTVGDQRQGHHLPHAGVDAPCGRLSRRRLQLAALVRYTERVRVQGAELDEAAHVASFADIEAARGGSR